MRNIRIGCEPLLTAHGAKRLIEQIEASGPDMATAPERRAGLQERAPTGRHR